MRIFPFFLIAIGVFGLLKHYGLVDAAFVQVLWPLVLIGIGAAMLVRGPRWRADMRERMHDRWERRMHRRFGPGWGNLSEEERERFREGVRQRNFHGGSPGSAPGQAASSDASFPPGPGDRR
ncbi:MAG: DUF5668 domain-containing protein [Pseudomonadota bacterium]|nr:DUF5668 domain-containing protein [Pseudomonadota bacterium]